MTRRLPAIALVLVVTCLGACGGGEPDNPAFSLSSNPISVRGWILDVKGAQRSSTAEMEIARRTELFANASVWIEETQYASGGVSGNGAFLILDVPPAKATIGFSAPGAENARLVLKDVPGKADVFIPDVILESNGATVLDPSRIVVRVPADVDKRTPTGTFAMVGPYRVPVWNAPLSELMDRRDYPNPGGFRPVATVK